MKVEWRKAADPNAFYWRKDPGGSGQADWNRPGRVAAQPNQPAKPETQVAPDEAALFSAPGVDQWMPSDPAKREAFKKAFRAWRSQVKPAFRGSALPAFLFLYSTAFLLQELRNELDAAGLWNMHTARQEERDNHPAWTKYCDHLGRAQVALATLPALQDYSLFTDLDKLIERLIFSEKRFRNG